VGEAGTLVTRVLAVKKSGEKTFVITDAGMTELIRPSHYGGVHPIQPVVLDEERETRTVDVVGPICETGDFLARNVEFLLPKAGDLLSVGISGAYGFTMASNYNSRPRAPEVMVDSGEVHLIRERESYEDLVRGEVVP
jgi:diaminopimelate decarboxylase